MRFRVAQQHGLSNAHSPFRVVEQSGREVEWINRYLNQQRIRGVADSSLRSYAHDLLHSPARASCLGTSPVAYISFGSRALPTVNLG
jgi:hypothetical protein